MDVGSSLLLAAVFSLATFPLIVPCSPICFFASAAAIVSAIENRFAR
jgi:hypothetical protein